MQSAEYWAFPEAATYDSVRVTSVVSASRSSSKFEPGGEFRWSREKFAYGVMYSSFTSSADISLRLPVDFLVFLRGLVVNAKWSAMVVRMSTGR